MKISIEIESVDDVWFAHAAIAHENGAEEYLETELASSGDQKETASLLLGAMWSAMQQVMDQPMGFLAESE